MCLICSTSSIIFLKSLKWHLLLALIKNSWIWITKMCQWDSIRFFFWQNVSFFFLPKVRVEAHLQWANKPWDLIVTFYLCIFFSFSPYNISTQRQRVNKVTFLLRFINSCIVWWSDSTAWVFSNPFSDKSELYLSTLCTYVYNLHTQN